jgi:hypothetical protein
MKDTTTTVELHHTALDLERLAGYVVASELQGEFDRAMREALASAR